VTILAATVAVIAGAGLLAQTRAEQEGRREQWQRVPDIFRAMNVAPGGVVADVGAGDGFFTSRLAAAVGPSGHVFAVDVSDSQLDRLRRRLEGEDHRNVTMIKGAPADPQLPAARLDAALIVNAYHEMTEYDAMLKAIRVALKPGGRLVLVEPIAESRRNSSRADLAREHQITPEMVMADVRAAGYRIIGLEDPFAQRERVVDWMIIVTPR
jgi:ubiquinone/menaquinone biosynthesis C-methylase UbiE